MPEPGISEPGFFDCVRRMLVHSFARNLIQT